MRKTLCFLLALHLTYVSSLPGIVKTLAGGGEPHKGKKSDCNDKEDSKDGIGTEARFNYPWGVAYDHNKHAVYVADCGCLDSVHRTDKIRKIDIKTGTVTTIAGSTQGFSDGFGKDAHFMHVAGITLDPILELLYIADSGNHRIRILYLSNNRVDTVAGLPSPGFVDQSTVSSQFNNPQSVAIIRTDDFKRRLYVADTDNHAIRVIHLETDFSGEVKTLAGGTRGFKDGYKLDARFYHPTDIVVDGTAEYMYVADHFNHAIRRIELKTGYVTTLSSQGFGAEIGLNNQPVNLIIHYPEGLVYDPDYNLLYVCEFENHNIRVVSMQGLVKTLAGEFKGKKDGVGRTARFYYPSGLAFDRKNRMLYVSDQYNHLVRTVTAIGSNVEYSNIKQEAVLDSTDILKKVKTVADHSSLTLNIMLCSASLLVGIFIARPCLSKLIKLLRP
ncbi:NHL repeat-containing protein 2 isoform X1 [Hydra vulgaris]|uniref:NHL repeat-containing protein 2 isoform X1 n=1 Tax=Hydra vulgaris TaxID=6087 RepID=UPI0006411006|nr:NHL repeat-containing protein 2 [Hydra vulgaris]